MCIFATSPYQIFSSMKGNMFLGYARGSVGDVVFSRVNGQQTARARNRKPENPKTLSQMIQRSRFAYLSKFYARASQKFFKFAFENKKANESDYNAFMSANVAITPYSTKSMVASPNTPWFAPFVMTSGSFPSVDEQLYVDDDSAIINLYVGSATATVGQLSQQIIDRNPWVRMNDIVTLCIIESSADTKAIENIADAMAHDGLTYDNGTDPSWKIYQFRVNTADTTILQSMGFTMTQSAQGYRASIPFNGSEVCGAVLVISRKTDSGLKVSTSHIQLSVSANRAYNVGLTRDWAEYCAVSWSANEDAVLEGSLIP